MERNDSVVGEALAPEGGGASPRSPTAFLANVTALLVKREIFDIGIADFPLHFL